ncbi:MAG: hypothetical protein ACRD2C_12265 [Acidimicrobiales bacterium]
MPSYAPPPTDGRRVTHGGGGGRGLLISLVVVLAVLAGGFAVVNLRAGGQTGAASPEEAATRFFDALADEDLIGVLEMLDPAERDVMLPFVQRLESELSRLGLTTDMDLGDVPGFELDVEGLETNTTELTSGMAEITVTGGVFRFRSVPEAVPIGDVLNDLIEANGGEVDIEATEDESQVDADDGLFFVATETDDRWHLSLFFTIAEYARRDAGYALPDLTAGVTPQGAPSAEDAVRQFAEAAADLDLERMIALLPPDQMRALHVYAPLFLEDAQADIEDFRAEEGVDITVDGLEFDSSSVAEGTRVTPTAGRITVDSFEGETSVAYADGCIEVSGEEAVEFEDEFGTNRVCPDDVGDLGDLSEEEEADLRELGELFSDLEPGIVVVERDGAFYIDPLGSFSDLFLQVFQGIERSDLQEGGILYRLFTGDLFRWNDFEDYEADWEVCDPAVEDDC